MKNPLTSRALALIGLFPLLLLAVPASVLAQTFHTSDADEQIVRFFADHTLGEVDGTLTPVTGTLTFDPAAPEAGLSGRFTADMTSFDTGLGLRDRDMHKKYLHTADYPEAVFILDDAHPILRSETSGDTLHLSVTGSMTLHGVTHDHQIEATLLATSTGYQIVTTFPLLLTDYNIKPPRKLMMKVKDQIRVDVHLTLVKENS